LEVPSPISFLAIFGFTNGQCFPENAPFSEFSAHLADIVSKVPICGESGLSKVDRPSRYRAKSTVIASRGDPHYLIVLQKHEFEKLLFSERR
jgi:hypothetical protein